jgi:hypothetical protein
MATRSCGLRGKENINILPTFAHFVFISVCYNGFFGSRNMLKKLPYLLSWAEGVLFTVCKYIISGDTDSYLNLKT